MNPLGGRGVAEVLLLLKVALYAAAGAVLAIATLIVFGQLDDSRRIYVGAVAVVVVMICIAAVAALQPTDGAHDGARPGPAPYPWPGPPPMMPPQPQGVGAFPPPPPAGPQWYDDAARHSAALRTLPAPGAAPAARAPAALPPVEPDIDRRPALFDEHPVPGRAGRRRRIVQCPRCAAFGVDVWDDRDGFAFGCQACQNQWRWTPGSPWPATVVRPALARTRPPTRPA